VITCNLGHEHPSCESCGTTQDVTHESIEISAVNVASPWLCVLCWNTLTDMILRYLKGTTSDHRR